MQLDTFPLILTCDSEMKEGGEKVNGAFMADPLSSLLNEEEGKEAATLP